jgi:ribulose-phosphate 3-epimerase
MIEIIPAIIPQDFEEVKEKMSLVNGSVHCVQIDICDGKFVKSKSWPYINDYDNDFKKITDEEEGFPFWESLNFEVDMMVMNPESVVEDWIRAGAHRIILHLESSTNIKDLILDLRNKFGWLGDSPLMVEIGLAINTNTPLEKVFEYLDPNTSGRSLVDFIQFMGIREIGYQGQFFDERVIGRIRDLRNAYPDVIISVDGGVNLDNASEIVDAGVNRLVSGSAVFESGDVVNTIEEFRKI